MVCGKGTIAVIGVTILMAGAVFAQVHIKENAKITPGPARKFRPELHTLFDMNFPGLEETLLVFSIGTTSAFLHLLRSAL